MLYVYGLNLFRQWSLKQQINVLKLIIITKSIGDELFKIPTSSEFSAFVQVIFLLLTETTNIYVRLLISFRLNHPVVYNNISDQLHNENSGYKYGIGVRSFLLPVRDKYGDFEVLCVVNC